MQSCQMQLFDVWHGHTVATADIELDFLSFSWVERVVCV